MVHPYLTQLLAEERIRELRTAGGPFGPAPRVRPQVLFAALRTAGGRFRGWLERGQLGPVPTPRCADC
jgi:hypothetical protein